MRAYIQQHAFTVINITRITTIKAMKYLLCCILIFFLRERTGKQKQYSGYPNFESYETT